MGLINNNKFLVFDSGYRGACNQEDDDQISYVLWLYYTMPWINHFHVTNEIKCSKQHGERLNRKGRKKGVSDNVILTAGHSHPYAVIEAKRKDKRKSVWREGQREFLNLTADSGGFSAVAYGLEELKRATKIYFTGVDNEAIFESYLAHNLVRFNERKVK